MHSHKSSLELGIRTAIPRIRAVVASKLSSQNGAGMHPHQTVVQLQNHDDSIITQVPH